TPTRVGKELSLVPRRQIDDDLPRTDRRRDAFAQHRHVMVRDAHEGETVGRLKTELRRRDPDRSEGTDELRQVIRADPLGYTLEDAVPGAVQVRGDGVTHTLVHSCS